MGYAQRSGRALRAAGAGASGNRPYRHCRDRQHVGDLLTRWVLRRAIDRKLVFLFGLPKSLLSSGAFVLDFQEFLSCSKLSLDFFCDFRLNVWRIPFSGWTFCWTANFTHFMFARMGLRSGARRNEPGTCFGVLGQAPFAGTMKYISADGSARPS